MFFFIYVIGYDRQAVGPPDGKRSPSPRDMCNTKELPMRCRFHNREKEEESVLDWNKRRPPFNPLPTCMTIDGQVCI